MPNEGIDPITAGGLAYVDDRMDEARAHWEGAFRDLREAGRLAGAARVATLLGELHWGGLGNPSVGRGWLERARRLLEQHGPCVQWGYWELARLACDRPDAVELEASARRALAIATEYGDVGLHTRALADLGFALVSQGRLNSGFPLLEEAVAAITGGEVSDPFAVSTTCCALLSACDRAGDVARATEWLRVVRDLVLGPADGRPRMLGAHCQVALGGVLCVTGEWSQAEAAVRSALDRASGATSSQRAQAAARLAELRLRQGRPDEAAELLLPIEDDVVAARPLAELHLLRGEPDLALAVLVRAESTLVGDVLRRAELLLLTVQTALSCRAVDAAERAASQLVVVAAGTDATWVQGVRQLASGLVAGAHGRTEEAIASLESANSAFEISGRPLLQAQTCLALAEVIGTSADAAAAARAAHAIAVRLQATGLRDRCAAVLRRLGASAPRPSVTDAVAGLTARETEILEGLRRGDTNAEIAGRLYLSPKTVEHHVSRVLSKLGVRTRAEAAAFAAALDIQR